MRTVIFSAFLACILLASVADALDDWTQQTPSPHPGGRNQHSMAYIGHDQVLLFGGWDGAYDAETWVYDLSENTWTQKSPTSNPAGRYVHDMAHIGGDQVLLFGGVGSAGSDDETWIYDLSENTWTQKSPTSSPSARYGHAMAYIGGDQVLLFGGYDDARDDETWVYDLSENTWTQRNPVSKPSERRWHVMAYIGGDQVLLFGGYDAGSYDDETWVYDLSENTWTLKNPSAPKPEARADHDMAYIGGDQVLVFGGFDMTLYNDTWIYDLSDNAWVEDTNTTQPSERREHGLSETSMDGSRYLVLFGGYDGTLDDETWTFGGGDYPLPVMLSSFTATGNQGLITLEWTTQSEWNNRGFHVYRREDSRQAFERITQELIAGAGNSSLPKHYTWQDRRVVNGQTYWYQLESVDVFGGAQRYGPISAAAMEALPQAYRLFPNHPNPFNPETWISYQLPQAGPMSIKIYNVHGQLVNTLVDGEHSPGTYHVRWDGRDLRGSLVASGIYFCQLQSTQFIETTKMILLR